MLTKPINLSLFSLGLIFAAISALCSTLLWNSFAYSFLDHVIASITAIALVIASFVFLPVIMRAFELKKWGAALTMLALEAVLVASSLGATIGWLESRYQAAEKNNVKSSNAYTNRQIQIDDLTRDIALLRNTAQEDFSNHYRTRALATMAQVNIKTAEREALINTPLELSNSSGTVLASFLEDNRWYLWSALALLVDGCPLACFALLSLRTDKPTFELTKPQPQTPLASLTEISDLKTEVTNGIRSGRWGDKPAIRRVIQDTSGRHPEIKSIFDELTKDGILKANGNRFERVA